jgi:hypothetical protein
MASVTETEATESDGAVIPDEARSEIKSMIRDELEAALAAHTQTMVAAIAASQAQAATTAQAQQTAALVRAIAQANGTQIEEQLPPLSDEAKQRALRLCLARWPGYEGHALMFKNGTDQIQAVRQLTRQVCRWSCRRILDDADKGLSAAIA